ncbi:MAG: HAD family hydrolase [Candidatus Korarchaeota archaeon]|nr:HAD family hydrolase [Candidatus Korarchaeota archaeon]NIU83496.1 HAD hydrolase-like protein [Candidatus Thorarchaeota archaeon]NIW13763.1 HAD hydrolase-like protein [Candidatus Thorarchaeota archaeon]NIW51862.1 HAD hydrolase-like protein [Candidatus Korarchaeota archaeon]
MLEDVKYIVFDLNGTIVCGRYPSYGTVLQKLGYKPKNASMTPFSNMKLQEIARGHGSLFQVIERHYTGTSCSKNEFFEQMTSKLYLRKNAEEVLCRLNDAGKTLLLCSDTTGTAKKVVEKFELQEVFKKCFYSCDVGFLKHEKDFWQHLLTQFPVKPRQFLVIGDNPATDIHIPNKLGMYTVLIPSGVEVLGDDYTVRSSDSLHEKPDFTIDSLDDLLLLL